MRDEPLFRSPWDTAPGRCTHCRAWEGRGDNSARHHTRRTGSREGNWTRGGVASTRVRRKKTGTPPDECQQDILEPEPPDNHQTSTSDRRNTVPHHSRSLKSPTRQLLQPFSQESHTATVPKVFQIGICGVVEADLELFWDSCSAGFLGERLYDPYSTDGDFEHCWDSCSAGFLGNGCYCGGSGPASPSLDPACTACLWKRVIPIMLHHVDKCGPYSQVSLIGHPCELCSPPSISRKILHDEGYFLTFAGPGK